MLSHEAIPDAAIANYILLVGWYPFAMLTAGLLGRIVSEAATCQINDGLTKLFAGILIGVAIDIGNLIPRSALVGAFT